jgi:hypothetical protein
VHAPWHEHRDGVCALHPLGTANHNLQRLKPFTGIFQGSSRTIGYCALRHVVLNSQYVAASSAWAGELAEEIRRLRKLRPHRSALVLAQLQVKLSLTSKGMWVRRNCPSTVADICVCGYSR